MKRQQPSELPLPSIRQPALSGATEEAPLLVEVDREEIAVLTWTDFYNPLFNDPEDCE